MIRVLNVIGQFSHGGIESQLLQILKSYDRSRFVIDVCCTIPGRGNLEIHAREIGTNIMYCPRSPNLYAFAQRFHESIRHENYDIVHSNFELWSGAILYGAYLSHVPIRIAHLHDIQIEGRNIAATLPGRIVRQILGACGTHWLRKYSTHILGASMAVLDARWSEWSLEPDKYRAFNAGVDVNRFFPKTENDDLKQVISVGSFLGSGYPNKRQDLLISIFAAARRVVPEAELMLVGTGPHERLCKRLAGELGASDSIHFLGASDDVPSLLRKASVFALCSEQEAMPTVLMEAQASGLAVLASDIPAHREVLAEPFHEFMFPLASPEKAVDSLIELLSNSSLRRRLGETGRSHVLENHNFSVQLDRLQGLYECALNSGHGSR
jgi:glycosyltransferase involved in cell wall biosynthesis